MADSGMTASTYKGNTYNWIEVRVNMDEVSIHLLDCFRQTVNSYARELIEHEDNSDLVIRLLKFSKELKNALDDSIDTLREEEEENVDE